MWSHIILLENQNLFYFSSNTPHGKSHIHMETIGWDAVLLSGSRRKRLSHTDKWTTSVCFEDGMEEKHSLYVNDYLGTTFMWLLERSLVSNGQTWWQTWSNLTSPYALFAILPVSIGKYSLMSSCCVRECLFWNICAVAIDIHCTYSLEAPDNLLVYKGPFSRNI